MSVERRMMQESVAMASEPADAFTDLPRGEWRDVFFSLPEQVKELVVMDMSRSDIEGFVDELDPDEVTDVLGYADEEVRDSILSGVDQQRRERIEYLLSFDPESAAGVMTLDYVTVGRVERRRRGDGTRPPVRGEHR